MEIMNKQIPIAVLLLFILGGSVVVYAGAVLYTRSITANVNVKSPDDLTITTTIDFGNVRAGSVSDCIPIDMSSPADNVHPTLYVRLVTDLPPGYTLRMYADVAGNVELSRATLPKGTTLTVYLRLTITEGTATGDGKSLIINLTGADT